MDTLLERARALLQSLQELDALALLEPEVAKNPEDVRLLQLYGEVLLEVNDVERAYQALQKATELDPEAHLGVEKFLYLGQIIGGQDGCLLLNIAILKLQDQLQSIHDNGGHNDPLLVELAKVYTLTEALATYLIKKINEAIFAEIEVWMTDLCMEPEAEEQCDKLISHSLALDDENGEAHSLLALIRISQQRNDEARAALHRAWQLFLAKKLHLEQEQQQEGEEASFEYIELVQPLLGLARFALELEMYEDACQISAAVAEINENALDCFYYEALAHLFEAKKRHAAHTGNTGDYREIELKDVQQLQEEDVVGCLAEVRSALTQGYRVINSAGAEASDPEVMDQVNEMLEAFNGPVMSELMPSRKVDDEDIDIEKELGI